MLYSLAPPWSRRMATLNLWSLSLWIAGSPTRLGAKAFRSSAFDKRHAVAELPPFSDDSAWSLSRFEYFGFPPANLMNAIVSYNPWHNMTAHRLYPVTTNRTPNRTDS